MGLVFVMGGGVGGCLRFLETRRCSVFLVGFWVEEKGKVGLFFKERGGAEGDLLFFCL